MRLRRLMARAAEHRDAITAARMAGWTWTEIGERLGVSGEAMRRAHARAQAAMQSGKLVPLEQTPLPDPPVTQATAPVATVPRSASLSGPEKKDEGDFMSRFSISRPTK